MEALSHWVDREQSLLQVKKKSLTFLLLDP